MKPSRAPRRPAEDALHLLVASSLAVAQPLMDLLGRHPTFFVAHGSRPRDIVLLTVLLVLGLPAVIVIVEFVIGLVSRSARDYFHVLCVGGLLALTVVPPIYRALGLHAVPSLVMLLAVALAAAKLYARAAPVRRLLTYASPAPIAFVALFLFSTPVRHLVLPTSPDAYAAAAQTETPIVLVTFDELALFGLLDGEGAINDERFPHFARLAATSTWYPNATTVHEHSNVVLSSLVTGTIAPHDSTPIPAEFPDTLFSLLGGSYQLDAHETITQLCPTSLCQAAEPSRRVGTLVEDAAIAFLHTAFPEDAARRLLPAIDSQWAGFRDEGTAQADGPGGGPPDDGQPGDASPPPERGDDQLSEQLARYQAFLAALDGSAQRSSLWFLHVLLPHRPWQLLPNGTVYPWDNLTDVRTEHLRRWLDDQHAADTGLQQHLLQLAYLDTLVGELLDRLQAEGLLDRSLLIVTADHGVSFQAGRSHRFTAEGAPPEDIIPVPLFVKLPRQHDGMIDDRSVELVDLVPTVADVVGIELPFRTDGVSLLDDPPDRPFTRVRWQDETRELPRSLLSDVEARAWEVEQLFGAGQGRFDLYGSGEYREIVGRRVVELDAKPPEPMSATLDDPDSLLDVAPAAPTMPARVTGSAPDRPSGTPIAVAFDGVVAGVAPSYVNGDGISRFAVMVHPDFLPNANDVAVYEVDGTPGEPSLRLVTRVGAP